MDKTLQLLARYESRNVTYMEEDRSWPIVWERARGMYVWDTAGKRYLDLTAAFGVHSALYSPTNKPPVVASGSVDVTGGIQVVTNPDAAGNGVPVSIWTRKATTKTGTPNTCYFDDFIRDQKNNASPAFEPNADGTDSNVITCDTCECSSSLSYQTSGNSQDMGLEVIERGVDEYSGHPRFQPGFTLE